MPLKRCDFAAVEGLAGQVTATQQKVQHDMDFWARTAGMTAADWQDNAGGRFSEVSAAWQQVAMAHQEMQSAVHAATVQAVAENQACVARSAARYA